MAKYGGQAWCQCLVPPPGSSIHHTAFTRVLSTTTTKSVESEREPNTDANTEDQYISIYLMLLPGLHLLASETLTFCFDAIPAADISGCARRIQICVPSPPVVSLGRGETGIPLFSSKVPPLGAVLGVIFPLLRTYFSLTYKYNADLQVDVYRRSAPEHDGVAYHGQCMVCFLCFLSTAGSLSCVVHTLPNQPIVASFVFIHLLMGVWVSELRLSPTPSVARVSASISTGRSACNLAQQ